MSAVAKAAVTGSPPFQTLPEDGVDLHAGESPIATARLQVIPRLNMKKLVVEDYASLKHYARYVDWKVLGRKAIALYMWKWYAIVAIAITLTVLITTQQEAVVRYCAPVAKTVRAWPGGWLIPLALLIIVSYPPLVGHEIIGILVGLVWGMGWGFAILAAGTFIGEIFLWFSFKWCCTSAAAKLQKKNKLYWSLTQLIREKTFTFVLILRFSAIPGHIVTAVSASAGANYWSYLAAAFLTLPKQLAIVYLGEAFGKKEKKHQIISTFTLIFTIVITGLAAVYIYYEMRLVWKRRELELPTNDLAMAVYPTWTEVIEEEKQESALKDTAEERAYIPQLGKGDMTGSNTEQSRLSNIPLYANSPPGGSRAWSDSYLVAEAEMKGPQQETQGARLILVSQVDDVPTIASSYDDAIPTPRPRTNQVRLTFSDPNE